MSIFQGAGISLPYVVALVNILGLPGLIAIFWYVDQRRIANIMSQHQQNLDQVLEKRRDDLDKVLAQYRQDTEKLSEMYKANVRLVENYERLADELANIIRLNTQSMTNLVDAIKNNMYCPLVRERGPNRDG